MNLVTATPLWALPPGWPLLAACVLALVPQTHRRASAATLACAGLAATLALVWTMPGGPVARAACLGGSAALAAHWLTGRGSFALSRIVPIFVSAGCLAFVALGQGLAVSAGLLGVQAVCVASVGLAAQRRARPCWNALLLDLSGAVLLLVASAVPAGTFAPVCASLGFAVLAGFGPRPEQGAADDVGGLMLARALLGVGAVAALGHGLGAASREVVLALGALGVWMAALDAMPQGLRMQMALAAMAITMPGGIWAAGVWCALALAFGAVAFVPGRFVVAQGPPWPGFMAAIWLVGACARGGVFGNVIALALIGGLIAAMMRWGEAIRRVDAMTGALVIASLVVGVVLERAA